MHAAILRDHKFTMEIELETEDRGATTMNTFYEIETK